MGQIFAVGSRLISQLGNFMSTLQSLALAFRSSIADLGPSLLCSVRQKKPLNFQILVERCDIPSGVHELHRTPVPPRMLRTKDTRLELSLFIPHRFNSTCFDSVLNDLPTSRNLPLLDERTCPRGVRLDGWPISCEAAIFAGS